MNLAVAYGGLITGVVVWLLLVRKLTTKSWAPSAAPALLAPELEPPAAAKIGLWAFLAVVTSLFALFITAYYIRMGHGHGAELAVSDWRAIDESPLLWLNSFVLLLASLSMQWSRVKIMRADRASAQRLLFGGGALTIAFLAGQLVVWQALATSAAFTMQNPAIGFFYLLTAVHALHLIGGMYVWARTYLRMHRRAEIIDVRLSIELCSIYWHYLLLVWLVLFGLLLAT